MSIPRYLVDGVLSVELHNGVYRMTFYEIVRGNSEPQACVELAIPVAVMKSLALVTAAIPNHTDY